MWEGSGEGRQWYGPGMVMVQASKGQEDMSAASQGQGGTCWCAGVSLVCLYVCVCVCVFRRSAVTNPMLIPVVRGLFRAT